MQDYDLNMTTQPSEEYLSCRWPHGYEVDLVVAGKIYWSDVGFRMAIDKWQGLQAKGIEAFIFPAKRTPTSFLTSV